MLPLRSLGQRLLVPAIGLGCIGMSHPLGSAVERKSVATIDGAMELGCNFFDTAEAYGPFWSEELLGRCLKGKRNQAVIATKFGYVFDGGQRVGVSSRPEQVRRSIEGSLRRLHTDRIDLVYQHRPDPNVPIEDVAGTISNLIHEGKVLHFGLKDVDELTVRRAHSVQRLTAVQANYSLWERGAGTRLLPVLRELGIGLVPTSPFGRGDPNCHPGRSARGVKIRRDNRNEESPLSSQGRYSQITATVQRIADLKGVAPPKIALAWLLASDPGIVPVPTTRGHRFLYRNVTAASVALSAEELSALNDPADRFERRMIPATQELRP